MRPARYVLSDHDPQWFLDSLISPDALSGWLARSFIFIGSPPA